VFLGSGIMGKSFGFRLGGFGFCISQVGDLGHYELLSQGIAFEFAVLFVINLSGVSSQMDWFGLHVS
jgi:hypothetical protein